jgi:hypothetical protein
MLLMLCVNIGNAQSAESVPEQLDNPYTQNKWAFWVGGFFPNVESEIRLDSHLGSPGDGLNLEDALGLEDSKTVLWGGARWRYLPRHQIELEISNLNRSGTNSAITDELDIGDETIRAGARIDTEFDLTLIRLTYGYSFFRRPKHDVAVKAGFHVTNFGLNIRAFGDILNVDSGQPLCNPSPCETAIETDSFTIPLPHLGLSYAYTITPKLALRSQLLFFTLKINDIKGTLSEVDLDLQYRPWENFGFGTGLRYFNVTVEDEGDAFIRGKFEYDFWGPVVYVVGTF